MSFNNKTIEELHDLLVSKENFGNGIDPSNALRYQGA